MRDWATLHKWVVILRGHYHYNQKIFWRFQFAQLLHTTPERSPLQLAGFGTIFRLIYVMPMIWLISSVNCEVTSFALRLHFDPPFSCQHFHSSTSRPVDWCFPCTILRHCTWLAFLAFYFRHHCLYAFLAKYHGAFFQSRHLQIFQINLSIKYIMVKLHG